MTRDSSSQAKHRWRALLVRVVSATLVAWAIASVPIPRLAPYVWIAYVQVPLVIFLLICYIGKLMIDTFYYDRYRP